MDGDNFNEQQPKLTQVENATITFPVFISVIGIISVALAVMLYHFILLRFCHHHRSAHHQAAPAQLAATSHPQISTEEVSVGPASWFGLDDRALESIPVLPYCERALDFFRIEQSDHECVVCLGKLERGERVRWLPGCAHAFHAACIDNWLRARASCPTCRTPVVVSPPLLRRFVDGAAYVNSGLTRARSGGALKRDGGDHKAHVADSDSVSVVGLKRSLSVDHSYVVMMDAQGGGDRCDLDFSSSSFVSSTSTMTASSLMRSIFGFMVQDGDHKILPY